MRGPVRSARTTRARRGDLTGAVDAARRRIQLQPLEELGYRTLMQLQADLGDRAGAREHLPPLRIGSGARARRRAGPGDAAGTPAPDGPRGPWPRGPGRERPAASSPQLGRPGSRPQQLIGRSAELGLLQDLWRTAAAGRAGLALVRGGAGVGKTRLVAEVAELARLQGAVVAGCPVLRNIRAAGAGSGRGLAAEPGFPVGDGHARARLARRGRPAGAVRGPRRARRPGQGHGGCLATAPVLRGPSPRTDGGRPPGDAGPGQSAVVRPGNPGIPHRSAWVWPTMLRSWSPGRYVMTDLGEDAELAGWTVQMRATGMLTELSLSPLEAADTARLAEAISGQRLLAERREPAPGDDRRLPAVRHRSGTQQCRSRQHRAAGR